MTEDSKDESEHLGVSLNADEVYAEFTEQTKLQYLESLNRKDSMYIYANSLQMPSGIPVATVAINGGKNAGILAAKILATSDNALLEKVKAYAAELKSQVEAKDARLQEVGYQNY